MNEVLLGLLGAALGLAFFACGFYFGRKTQPVQSAKKPTGAVMSEPTEEEKAEVEKERDRLIAEQNAFHDLLGYNADVAYGRAPLPGKE